MKGFWDEIFSQVIGGERSLGFYPTEVDILTRQKSSRSAGLMILQKIAGEIAPPRGFSPQAGQMDFP
jgi:hypothetical protein